MFDQLYVSASSSACSGAGTGRAGGLPCVLYFTRLSIDEEGVYSAIPDNVACEIRETAHRIPESRAILDAYRTRLGVNLIALINAPRLDVTDAHLHKLYQTGLHAVLAIHLQRQNRLDVRAVGFYSGGATSAFLFAGCYSAAGYIEHVFAFNKLVRERMAVEGRSRTLVQVLLAGNHHEDVDGFVTRLLHDGAVAPNAYIKDRRQSHVLLVAGPPDEIRGLVAETENRFASVRDRRSPILKHRFASHSPYLDARVLAAGTR